jgi:hypothetical protein
MRYVGVDDGLAEGKVVGGVVGKGVGLKAL